jgi:imidazolonepropionase-like amidohydrolase
VGEHADKFPPAIAVKARAAAAQMQQTFQHAVKIGVPLAMGTDAGVEPHGLNANEFSLMTKNGLPAVQALLAGTANGAELLGMADRIGTLSPGKFADIVAVAGNPLIDMHATEHPVLVMREGIVYLGDRDARAIAAGR